MQVFERASRLQGMESKDTIPQNTQSFIICVLFAKDGGISLNTSYAVK